MENKKVQGKGEWDYDNEYDILIVKMQDRDYAYSIEMEDSDLTLEIDKKGLITGICIFDAAEFLKMEKEALKNIKHAELSVKKEGKMVMIRIVLRTELANKEKMRYVQDFSREIKEIGNAEPYQAMCTI